MTGTPTNESQLYLSNCTCKGNGQIRIDNNMFKLYLGMNNNITKDDTDLSDEDKAIVVTNTDDVYVKIS